MESREKQGSLVNLMTHGWTHPGIPFLWSSSPHKITSCLSRWSRHCRRAARSLATATLSASGGPSPDFGPRKLSRKSVFDSNAFPYLISILFAFSNKEGHLMQNAVGNSEAIGRFLPRATFGASPSSDTSTKSELRAVGTHRCASVWGSFPAPFHLWKVAIYCAQT